MRGLVRRDILTRIPTSRTRCVTRHMGSGLGAPLRRCFGGLALALALVGCSATVNNHGFVPPEEELSAILPGVDTRDSVALTVGEPSATGVIEDNAWFYSAYQVRSFAYRAPEIVDRDIVAIAFDEEGVVEAVERYGLEDGRFVHLSRRVTDNGIGDVTLLTQIIRNFGRINVGDAINGNN